MLSFHLKILRYALKMVDLNKFRINNSKNNHEKEFQLLKLLDSPYLIKLISKDFKYDEFYCFVMELCQVNTV